MAPAPKWKPPGGGIRAPSRGITAAVRTKRGMEAARKKPVREAASVDAPPLSSSDDDGGGDGGRQPGDISDSSSPDHHLSRGHIKSTVFTAKTTSATSGGSGSESGQQRGTKRPRPEDSASKTSGDLFSNSNGTSLFGRSSSQPAPKAIYGGRQRVKYTLAPAPARSTSSTSTKSTKSKPVFKKYEDSASDISEPEDEPKRKTSPRKTSPPAASRPRFIKPPELSPEKPDTPEKAKTPPKFKASKWAQSDDDSEDSDQSKKRDKEKKKNEPPARPVFKQFKPRTRLKDLSSDDEAGTNKKRDTFISTTNAKTKRAGPKDAKDSEDPERHITKKELMQSRQKWRKRHDASKLARKSSQIFGQLDVEGGGGSSSQGTRSTSPSSSAPQPPLPPPRAVFKMPELNSDSFPVGGVGGGDSQDDSVDLAQLLSDDTTQNKDDGDDNNVSVAASDMTMEYKGPAICPLCKEPLDEAILRDLLPNHYLLAGVSFARIAKTRSVIPLNLLKFDEKVRFCQGHKQRTNRLAWAARGYPAIDWDALPARIVRHEKHIHNVLVGKKESTFRVTWEAAKTMDAVAALVTVPGYYGSRGLRVLSDAIVERHASTLRKRVVEDTLLASRGMYQFVQAVLVPELAMQLIREDMQQGGAGMSSEDEVRKVLVASAGLGEELAEEIHDVVEDEEGDEDEDVDEDEDEDGDPDDDGQDCMST